MAHFDQFFCDAHSPYVKYGSCAPLERTGKLHSYANLFTLAVMQDVVLTSLGKV